MSRSGAMPPVGRKWPLVGNLLFCLACHQLMHHSSAVQTPAVTPKSNVAKPDANATNSAMGVDELLRDTFQLLDSLDQRLDAVANKTADKRPERAPDNYFRPLKASAGATGQVSNRNLEEERRLTSLAEGFSSERRPAAVSADEADPLSVASSEAQQHQSAKRTRQLVPQDEGPLGVASPPAGLSRFTDNDFTEKHIRFSLDLMRAVFSSQSHTSKSNAIDSFLISPVSIQMVLMMMHLGARGQTKRELNSCLHLVTPAKQAAVPAVAPVAASSSSPNTSSTSTSKPHSKLFRRHQQTPSPVAPQAGVHKQPAHAAHSHHQQPQAASSSRQTHNSNLLQHVQQAQSNNVHEQFGGAMRQLLKDQTVVKALSSANQIFVQRDLSLAAQYEWAVRNYYGAELKHVDFQNQEQQSQNRSSPNTTSANNIQLMINDWVERQTKGKISNFLSSPVPSSTLLMALNVLFFKGDWQYKFDPADTDPDAWFTLTNGRTVKVPMMVNKLPLAHAHDPTMKASLIELPYKAQRLGLFILLPDEVNGIFETMQLLNPSSFANLISMMRKPSSANSAADPHGAAAGINVRIPKFTIESSPRMSHILSQQLGLKTLFSPDQADLSGMFSPKRPAPAKQTSGNLTGAPEEGQSSPIQVGLDELHHKAILQVHEQGSVAAAASATIVERVGLFNSQYFEADHPFLLFLMDKQTGLVLFSGVFAGPPGTTQEGGAQSDRLHQADGPMNATGSPDNGNHLAGRSLEQTAATGNPHGGS